MKDSQFEVTSQDDYIQLSPIGLFPHARGLQNVDKTALESLVKNFKSFFARLGRRFAGLPFYVGHPDVPGYEATYNDRKAYGWIMDLEAREDGLYGRPKWSAAGRDLIANGHYKFLSPTWNVERIGTNGERPVYRPTSLISVGLTNQPNLPVLPLANCDTPDHEPETLTGMAMKLINDRGTDEGQARASEANDEARMPNDPPSPRPAGAPPYPNVGDDVRSLTPNSDSDHNTGKAARPPFESEVVPGPPTGEPCNSTSSLAPRTSNPPSNGPFCALCASVVNNSAASPAAADARVAALETQIAQLQEHLFTTILDNAILDARIFPAERARWRAELEDDFEAAHQQLSNAKPRLPRAARTDALTPSGCGFSSFEEKQKRLLTLVNERMRTTGLSYHEAWLQVRAENPQLI